MKTFLLAIALMLVFAGNVAAQAFPNPATLSTGQGTPGSFDPIWTVSQWYATNPPNPLGLTYGPALINNNCAPGSWVDPSTLPPPVNNGSWITGGSGTPCSNNTNDGYMYFRLTLDLPADCNGNSVATTGSYVLYLQGYSDNTITDIFVNGTSTGINGGSYSAPLSITLNGPWVAGVNYVDVQVYNFPNGGSSNPYGLLLVANSAASSVADGDGDGVADINDVCPCESGTLANGCSPVIITGDTVLCLGESTTLTATGNGTFFWNNGSTSPTITVNPVITTRYSVVATASTGYQDSAVVWVTVNSLPVVSVNPITIGICEGNSSTLTAAGAANYVWSNTATTSMVSVSPTSTAVYSVTGIDANSCSATAGVTVTVYSLPVAVVNPATVAVCNGESTTLTATGGSSYLWNDASNNSTLTVSPTGTTSYSVTVTDVNTCSATVSSTVTVNALPAAVINPATAVVCNGENITLTAGGGISYVWSNASTAGTVTVSPTSTTSYLVTVTDANTCTGTATADVIVNPLPVAVISPIAVTICLGESATLTASGGTGFLWSDASITAATTVSPVNTTSYLVTVTDVNTCTGSTSATVTVIPAMILSTTKLDVDCNGNSSGAVDLTVASGQSPYTYLWNTGGTGEDPVGLASGNYLVTVIDNAGCSATISEQITEPVVLSLTSSFTNPTCETNGFDGSITLNTTGGTLPYQFIWSTGTGSSSILNVAPGNYDVTVSDANNCSLTASFTLAYIYDFSIQATPPITIKMGESTTIGFAVNGNAGNYSSVWSPSQTLSCSDCVSTVASPNATTLYQIEVRNDAGCTAIDDVTVSVIPDYSVFVPNAFTPNNDGNNDVFRMFGIVRSIVFLEIQIFNRAGEKVFESLDHEFVWDGTYKGVMQNPSVFIWQMKLTFIDGHREELRKGTVTLLK